MSEPKIRNNRRWSKFACVGVAISLGLNLGCVGPRIYDTSQVTGQFHQGLKVADTQSAAARHKWREQQNLVDQLARKTDSAARDTADQARGLLTQMGDDVAALEKHKNAMDDLNREFLQLAERQSQIRSDEATWPRADQVVTTFQINVRGFNQVLKSYQSRALALDGLLSRTPLKQVSLAATETLLQTAARNWRAAHKKLEHHLTKYSKQPKTSAEATSQLHEMSSRLKALGEQVKLADQRLADFEQTFAGQTAITQEDTKWADLTRLRNSHREAETAVQQDISGFVQSEDVYLKATKTQGSQH